LKDIQANTIIGNIKNTLHQAIIGAFEQARANEQLQFETIADFLVEVPREETHGDFSTNAAMMMAKACKKSPRVIAEILSAAIDATTAGVDTIEIAGPGFINFRMHADWLNNCLAQIITEGEDFGRSDVGKGHKIQVEFVSANPTGELHMGNARGAAIGDSLASLLDLAGFTVEREFYINDAGNQIEKFALSLEARYLQLLDKDIEFPEDGYHGNDIITVMKQFIAQNGDKYLDCKPEIRRPVFAEYALVKKLADIKQALSDFGVKYDVWFSERTLHESGAVTNIVKQLQNEDWVYSEDGALWLDCRRFGEEKGEVLVRANGIPTYFAADIAYHQNKFQRGFETVIDIWGADHHGHVARMKGAMEAIGYQSRQLEVLLMQFVRLYQNGEILKMSKRTGTYVTLKELVEDVGRDAARFFFVTRSADSLIDFDLDLAKSQTADNPVFYVQYAHARICSILAAAAIAGLSPQSDTAHLAMITEDAELSLIRKLADYPDEIIFAAVNREPQRIAIYLQEVAAAFHNFYAHCRVISDEHDLSEARLSLAQSTAQVIRSGLKAIGVSAPEKM